MEQFRRVLTQTAALSLSNSRSGLAALARAYASDDAFECAALLAVGLAGMALSLMVLGGSLADLSQAALLGGQLP
jgi:hypothetical protein